VLAEKYQWTPEQVNRMDPDFIEEVLARTRAEAEIAEARRKEDERKANRRKRGGPIGEPVDLSEIV